MHFRQILPGRLARATGARIHIHSLADAGYPHEPFEGGRRLELGAVSLEPCTPPASAG